MLLSSSPRYRSSKKAFVFFFVLSLLMVAALLFVPSLRRASAFADGLGPGEHPGSVATTTTTTTRPQVVTTQGIILPFPTTSIVTNGGTTSIVTTASTTTTTVPGVNAQGTTSIVGTTLPGGGGGTTIAGSGGTSVPTGSPGDPSGFDGEATTTLGTTTTVASGSGSNDSTTTTQQGSPNEAQVNDSVRGTDFLTFGLIILAIVLVGILAKVASMARKRKEDAAALRTPIEAEAIEELYPGGVVDIDESAVLSPAMLDTGESLSPAEEAEFDEIADGISEVAPASIGLLDTPVGSAAVLEPESISMLSPDNFGGEIVEPFSATPTFTPPPAVAPLSFDDDAYVAPAAPVVQRPLTPETAPSFLDPAVTIGTAATAATAPALRKPVATSNEPNIDDLRPRDAAQPPSFAAHLARAAGEEAPAEAPRVSSPSFATPATADNENWSRPTMDVPANQRVEAPLIEVQPRGRTLSSSVGGRSVPRSVVTDSRGDAHIIERYRQVARAEEAAQTAFADAAQHRGEAARLTAQAEWNTTRAVDAKRDALRRASNARLDPDEALTDAARFRREAARLNSQAGFAEERAIETRRLALRLLDDASRIRDEISRLNPAAH